MVAVTASLVSAKTVAVSFAIVTASFIIAAAVRPKADPVRLELGQVTLYVRGFLLYALLSATWAQRPEVPLEKASVALLIAAGTALISSMIRTETRPKLLHIGCVHRTVYRLALFAA